MNTKQLMLLTALLVPGISNASRLGDAFFERADATRSQIDQVFQNPTNPNLDPGAVSNVFWDAGILTTILEKNPNPELQAVAAYWIGEELWGEAEESAWVGDSFYCVLDDLRSAKQHYKKAIDLLAKLEQTKEIKDISAELKSDIKEFSGWGAQSVQDCQELINIVTKLGYKVKQTAQEIYTKYYA